MIAFHIFKMCAVCGAIASSFPICRNSALQRLLEMIGGWARASGGAETPKKGWADNKWTAPEIKKHFGQNDDRVELTL